MCALRGGICTHPRGQSAQEEQTKLLTNGIFTISQVQAHAYPIVKRIGTKGASNYKILHGSRRC